MRLALVVYGSLEQVSGGYLYDRQVVSFLRRQGVEVDVHSLRAAPYFLCTRQNFQPRLRRLLRRGRGGGVPYDAVVLDELVHPSAFLAVGRSKPGSAAQRAPDRPPVFTLVDHLKSDEGGPALRRAAARVMERRLLRGSDRLLVNSRTTEASVRRLASGCPPAWVCPPGCDLQEAPLPPAENPAGPERPAGAAPRLLVTGNLIPRKGHDLLLQALAGLRELPWQLRVVGRRVDRRYGARLRRLAAASGISERVVFSGELSGAALAAEYAEADVFVFASRYEGWGISLAEALRAGLPFVAFASGAVPELVGGDAPGLVAAGDVSAFREALRRLLAEPSFRAAEAARSRRIGTGLPTWEQTGRCFHRALLEGAGRG